MKIGYWCTFSGGRVVVGVGVGAGWHDGARTGERSLRSEPLDTGREQLGRDVPVTVMNAPADKDVLARLADAGVERALLGLPRADRDATLRTLDGHAGLVT